MRPDSSEASDSSVPVALIGAGAIAESFYLPAFKRIAGALDHVILVDSNEARAKAVASQYGISQWATDYRRVLGDVVGAIIAVPHHLHYPLAKDALTHGVHVLCEKPLTENAEDARQLVSIAKEHNAILTVNLTRRLAPHSEYVKKLLAEGAVGQILSVEYLDGSEFRWPTTTGFYFDHALSSKGVLLDIGSHVMDMIRWWLGATPTLVSSQNDSFGGYEAVADVRLRSGLCDIHMRLSRLAKLPNTFEIRGEKGWIKGRVYDSGSITIGSSDGRERVVRLSQRQANMAAFADKVLGNFFRAIRGEADVMFPAEDVVPSLELIDAAYETAKRFAMPWYEMSGVQNVR
jgi:predicted dehydrogenase